MSLNQTPSGGRVHIAFFGRRNAGKSSLVNAVAGQPLAVVSPTAGTTTDPVRKSMELLPLGPVLIIDTPGYDDVGALGDLRVQKTKQVLRETDIAVLVVDGAVGMTAVEDELLALFRAEEIPHVVAVNKIDALEPSDTVFPPSEIPADTLYVSATEGTGITALKEHLARQTLPAALTRPLLGDLIQPGDIVLLVTPIDSAAPKGRMILPQQQAIRDVLDSGAICVTVREHELATALDLLQKPPALVVTDSQAFEMVAKIVPETIPLTSFSILFARYKGFFAEALRGAATLDTLQGGETILIAEGCTHHRQCDDIGTVKLPNWIRAATGKTFNFQFTAGKHFPDADDLSTYALVVHCGGCMLNPRELMSRTRRTVGQNVPFTNYGVLIAKMQGILERTTRMLTIDD